MPGGEEFYKLNEQGIHVPVCELVHREEEYPSEGASRLYKMQRRHFWYLGRFRFVMYALRATLNRQVTNVGDVSAIDIGGGSGGWIDYVQSYAGELFDELAVGDSSLDMLRFSKKVLGERANLYQVDALDLRWRKRWNIIFLLDVLEHLTDPTAALVSSYEALKPGGAVILTLPALQLLWSHVDELSGHTKRFCRRDICSFVEDTGFELERSRYFMFFLSPLLLIRRRGQKLDVSSLSEEEIARIFEENDRVPFAPLNRILTAVFSLETPLGYWFPFPWGSSLLAVLTKPYE